MEKIEPEYVCMKSGIHIKYMVLHFFLSSFASFEAITLNESMCEYVCTGARGLYNCPIYKRGALQ